MEKTGALDIRIKAWFTRMPSIPKCAFLSGCIIGFFVHVFYISNIFANEDFFIPSGGYLSAGYGFGRWFLGASIVFLRYSSPAVVGVLTILILSLCAAFSVYALNIQSKIFAVCFAALMVTFPSTAYLSGYISYLFAYTLALLLAILAFVMAERGRYGWIVGGIFLCFSLGIYQSYISVTMTLCLSGLLFVALQPYENIWLFWRTMRIKLLKYAGMGGFGVVLYYVSLKIIFAVQGYILQGNYTGITQIGDMTVIDYLKNTAGAYKGFLLFFLQGNLFKTSAVAQMCIYIILLSALFCGVLLLMRIPSFRWQKIIIIVLCVAFPLCTNVMQIVAPQIGVNVIGCNAYVLFWGIIISIIEKSCLVERPSKKGKMLTHYLPFIVASAILLISFNYYLLSNVYYMKADAFYKRTLSFANRIVMRMEQLPEFRTNMPIAILGDLPNDSTQNSSYMFPEIINDRGLWGQYIGTRYNNNSTYKLSGFMDYHLGVPMNGATEEQISHIKSTQTFWEMDIWPIKDSVQIIDGIMVIKLNYTYTLEAERLGAQHYRFTIISEAANVSDEYTYAWYIDAPSGSREYGRWYEDAPSLEYHFNAIGKYTINIFVQDANGELMATQSQSFEIE